MMLVGIIGIVSSNAVYNAWFLIKTGTKGIVNALLFNLQFVLAIVSCVLAGASAASGLSAARHPGWFVPEESSGTFMRNAP